MKVLIDQKEVVFENKIKLVNGRTMVPLRQTMELLGSKVEWENKTDKVYIIRGKNKVTLQFNNPVAYQNGDKWVLETAPFVEKGITYVPLRFISEGFHFDVKWDAKNQLVNIFTTTEIPSSHVKVPVLMYHHLTPNGETASEISPKRFREHMMTLKNNGFSTITDQELLDFLDGKGRLPNKPVMITFDDGYRSNYLEAYPILKELGMKATVYLITSRVVDGTNLYPNEIPKFSWEEAKDSLEVFSFQGHTHDFHYKGKNQLKRTVGMITGRMFLTSGRLESHLAFRDRVYRDLLTSKNLIEKKLGTSVITLAYPFGEYSNETIQLAKKAGYQMGLTVKTGVVQSQDNPFTLNRITANGYLSGQELMMKMNKYD